MPEVVFIKRPMPNIPFGFKLQGGYDFSIPLSILEITPNSIADQAGLRPGDAITKINNTETSWMEHARAKQEIVNAGDMFWITIERNAVNTAKPQHTPFNQLRTKVPINMSHYVPPPPVRTNLMVDKGESILVGSSHNRAPMPFNREVGNTIVYQAAKPTNWSAGDYTRLNEPDYNQQPKPIVNNQYNTPIGLYSKANVIQEIKNLNSGNNSNETSFQNPSQYKTAAACAQPLRSNPVPRGCDSLSMRMLNQGLDECTGTNQQAPSVFDLKRGNNPTGATVPRGFRSVMAPVELPPEQRHAPMHKEYQVTHVKKNWIEPKIN